MKANHFEPAVILCLVSLICLYLLMCHQVPHNAVWPRDPKRENVCPRPNFRAAKLSANVYWLRHLLSLILFRFVFVHWCRSLWSGKHNRFNFNKSCMNLKSQVNVGGNYYFFTKQVRCKFAVTEVMPAFDRFRLVSCDFNGSKIRFVKRPPAFYSWRK